MNKEVLIIHYKNGAKEIYKVWHLLAIFGPAFLIVLYRLFLYQTP